MLWSTRALHANPLFKEFRTPGSVRQKKIVTLAVLATTRLGRHGAVCPPSRLLVRAVRLRTLLVLRVAADSRPSVLISGSSTGIGKVTALHLARKGWRVFAGVRRPEDGESLVAEEASLEPLLLDVSSDASVAAAAAEVAARLAGRPLAGLVNNAGKGVFMPLEVMPVALFQDVMDINVTGVLRLTQAALPLLKRSTPDQQPGRIVNIGSYAGTIAIPLFGAYAASKFGLEALSDVMRYEFGPKWGIRTVLIKASAVKTPIWDKSLTTSEAELGRLDPAALAPYRGMCDEIMALSRNAEETGITAEEVAATIEEALSSPNPRSRYLIGNGAASQMAARRLLPDWIWDRLLLGSLERTSEPWQ